MAKISSRLRNAVIGFFLPDGSGTVTPTSSSMADVGVTVSEQTAMQLAAVWACVRLIAETIAALPFGVYQKVGSGKRYASEHPLHLVLHEQPNRDSTACVFWEAFVAAMLLPGNAYCEKLLIGSRLVGLRFLPNGRLYRAWYSDHWRYWFTEDNGTRREIPAANIWRVPGFSLDGVNGVSAIEYGANVLGMAQAGDAAAAKNFKQGLMPTIAYQYPTTLKEKQREDARKYIIDQSGILSSGRPIILEGGMEAKPLGVNPKDAQLLETRQFSRMDICAWFRVPPWMVGYGEKSTAWGTGMEQQMQAFLTFVLQPWLVRIEQHVAKDLLTPADKARGYYCKRSVEGLLRGDSAARADFYDKMIKAAVMTPDQARELEEYEAIGGNAGKLIVNSATTLLDDLGSVQNEPTQI